MHFPKLKLIWSPSPSATSQLFEELKVIENLLNISSVFWYSGQLTKIYLQKDREQPDATKAAEIGVEENADEEFIVDKYNKIQDLVSKLPGVHSKNVRALLNKGQSMDHLITLTQVFHSWTKFLEKSDITFIKMSFYTHTIIN